MASAAPEALKKKQEQKRDELDRKEEETYRSGKKAEGTGSPGTSRKVHVASKARSKIGELTAINNSLNIHTLAFDGASSITHRELVGKLCQTLGCKVVGLPHTRRDEQSFFAAVEYVVYYSSDISGARKARHHGNGVTFKGPILEEMARESIVVEYVSDRLMKV